MDSALFITLFADASHCPTTKACGWASWIKYGDPAQTQRLSGSAANVKNSHLAEVMALEKGIAHIEQNLALQDKIIVLQSDCQGALDYLAPRAEGLKAMGARHVKLKWVKSHNGHKDVRSSVNTWCDETARHHMRELRNLLLDASL